MELHPLCTLFPRLSGFEFECLKLDIKENGQREPIIIHEGMILDGGNRYRACIDIGIEPQTVQFSGKNIVTFVLSANLHRRHLTPGQQAAIVACVQDWAKAQTSSRPKKECNVAPLSTTKDRAAQPGASIRTQKTADKIAKADPELAASVGRGEISLPKAEKQAFPKPEIPDVQPEEPEYTELDALHDQITELQNIVASGFAGVTDEDRASGLKMIAGLRQEIKTLTATLEAVTSSRDYYQRENAQMKTQLASQRRELEKLRGAKC